MKRLLFRILKPLLYTAYLVFASTFLFFTLLEFAPELSGYMNLHSIRYYAQWQQYRPDDKLVFIPAKAAQHMPTSLHTQLAGDSYSPEYGFPQAVTPYNATYTSDGFRGNSATSDFKILVVGDSYVEIGEEDSLTVSEQLKQASGLATFNLGRGWYGPFQYLELLKRYVPTVRPRYAVLCFFDGNDAEDTKQFLKWQRGRSYYTFVLSTKSYINRYFTAFRDTRKYLLERITSLATGLVPSQATEHPAITEAKRLPADLGFIRIGDESVPMRFLYWNQPKTTEELVKTEEWMAIGRFLKEYERVAAEYGIQPIIVFVPTKIEVYGSQFLENNSAPFVEKINAQLPFENNSHDAFLHLVKATNLHLVDLLPEFRKQAKAGKLLYYPFDSHWNIEGRRLAATLISRVLVDSR